MISARGFSLMEVLVSLAIFSAGLIVVASGASINMRHSTGMEWRTEAMEVAQRQLEGYRPQDPATLPSTGTATTNYVLGKRTYNVTVTFCKNTTYCNTQSRNITVDVSYKGKKYASIDTIYTQLK